jgi:glycopeptide antibiotics resistance protein
MYIKNSMYLWSVMELIKMALDATPWTISGCVVVLIITILIHRWVGYKLQISRWLAFALLLSIGAILSITMAPYRGLLDFSAPSVCSTSVHVLVRLSTLKYSNDRSLNVLLFLPFGFCCLLPRRRSVAVALFVGAFFFPFAIEGMQYLLPMLGRRCDAADVIDNLIGLFLGGAIGLVVRLGSLGMRWIGSMDISSLPTGPLEIDRYEKQRK